MEPSQYRRRIDARTIRRGGAYVAAASVAAAVAVPLVEALAVSRAVPSPVPGPHHQDGLIALGGCESEPVPIVWLGDSLAAGVGAGHSGAAFPRRAAELLSDMGCSVDLSCLAVSGARVRDVLASQLPQVLDRLDERTVVVVTVGSNDVAGLTTPRRFHSEYRQLLTTIGDTGATVVAVGLPAISAATVIPQPLRSVAGWVGRRADRKVRRLADRHGAHYVAIGVTPPRGTDWAVYLAADRWHPNDDTYHLWAEGMVAMLSPLLLARLASATPTGA